MEDPEAYEIVVGDNNIVWAFGTMKDSVVEMALDSNIGTNVISIEFAPELVHLTADLGICIVSNELWKNAWG